MVAASVPGTLYDIDGCFPALMLNGGGRVHGEVWRCPTDLLSKLDDYERVERGLFRRVAIEVDGMLCWTYVAGPTLARKLTRTRRIASGDWFDRDRVR